MKPLLSCLIPTYNEQEYVPATIKRLSSQSIFDQMELIFADYDPENNGRTLDAIFKAAIEQDVKPDRLKVLGIDRKGIGYARHKAALVSSADILMSFDADAYFTDNAGAWRLVNPIVRGRSLMTCCNNVLDPMEATKGDNSVFRLADLVYRVWNMGESPWETGLTIGKEAYNQAGGFPDVPIGEGTLLYLNFALRYGPGAKSRIDDVYVQVSARRPRSMSNGLTLPGFLKAFDYSKAYR